MITPLDVFELKYHETNWLGCAQTLEAALDLALEQGEGRYCVFSQRTRKQAYYDVSSTGTMTVANRKK